jgi:hypothetical protein
METHSYVLREQCHYGQQNGVPSFSKRMLVVPNKSAAEEGEWSYCQFIVFSRKLGGGIWRNILLPGTFLELD